MKLRRHRFTGSASPWHAPICLNRSMIIFWRRFSLDWLQFWLIIQNESPHFLFYWLKSFSLLSPKIWKKKFLRISEKIFIIRRFRTFFVKFINPDFTVNLKPFSISGRSHLEKINRILPLPKCSIEKAFTIKRVYRLARSSEWERIRRCQHPTKTLFMCSVSMNN